MSDPVTFAQFLAGLSGSFAWLLVIYVTFIAPRFKAIEGRMDLLDKRMDRIETRLAVIESRLLTIERVIYEIHGSIFKPDLPPSEENPA